MKSKHLLVIVAAMVSLLAGAVGAEDAYYSLPLGKLRLDEGVLPESPAYSWNLQRRQTAMRAYVVLEGEGEAYIKTEDFDWNSSRSYQATVLVVRVPAGRELSGRLILPKPDLSGMTSHGFKIPADAATPEARSSFQEAKALHYERLLQQGIPGAAWFRHQAEQARAAQGAGKTVPGAPVRTRMPVQQGDLEDSYALFSGGRALSESLQLDRAFPALADGEAVVDVDSLPGITVQEMDWKPLIEGLKPETDPLGALIPADQHALFFKSFQSMIDLMDEAEVDSAPAIQWIEPRSEDAGVRERYQRQLCLDMSDLSRLLGPKVVASVAFTGSDPYLRTGSDVAVLFETQNPGVLKTFFSAKHALALQDNAVKSFEGKVGDLACAGVRSADRRVCSYVATVGDVVVVTNSLHQLGRLSAVSKGAAPALASLLEYRFFRNRYPRGDADETAFLILSDATIRRWCGPRWRIADSRRTRAAGLMAEHQTRHLRDLVAGTFKSGPLEKEEDASLQLGPRGIASSNYGTLEFLTPIVELPFTKVSKAEADAYDRFRETYQQNWRQFFDPIAIRFSVKPERIGADLTIMPLIEGTDYREFMAFTKGVKLAPSAGDPHAESLVHLAMGINPDGEELRQVGNMASVLGLKVDPLGWLGSSVSLYWDGDPFLDELAKAPDAEQFIEKEFHRAPVALNVDVKSALKLTAFLAGLRAFVEQTAPGMTVWESLTHNGQAYVRIAPSEETRAQEEELKHAALYYAATPNSLVLTLNETVLKRALDRQAARKQPGAAPVQTKPWLGESLGLKADRRILDALQAVMGEDYRAEMQARAWSNLPILNEWKRLYPGRDPVHIHETFWQTRLVCPGGGTYVWDETAKTMASTVYGHPATPKAGPAWPALLSQVRTGSFGLTFEPNGLRVRAELERETPR